MVGAIADWKQLFQQILSNLKPGGLLEMQEYEGWVFSSKDFSHTDISNWQNLVNEASSKFGKELDVARKLKPLMEEAGFVDVKEQIVKVSRSSQLKRHELTRPDPRRPLGQRQTQQTNGHLPARAHLRLRRLVYHGSLHPRARMDGGGMPDHHGKGQEGGARPAVAAVHELFLRQWKETGGGVIREQ